MPTIQRLLTDATGQSLVTAINNIVAAVKPNATEIQMSSSDTTTVATAITNINDKMGTVPSGQTIEGQITTLNSKLWTIKTIDNTTVSQTPKTYSLEDYKTYLVVASHTSGGVEIDIINTYNNSAQLVQLSNGTYCTVTLDGMTLNITAEYGNHLGIICF